MQTQLKESQQFKGWIEAAPDGIFCADATGRIVYGNTKICELLGYGAREFCELTVADTYHPSEAHIASARLDAASIGVASVCERRMRRKNGTFRFVEIHYVRLPTGFVIGVVRDIQARRDIEGRLRAELALARLGNQRHVDTDSGTRFLAAIGENLDWDYIGYWRQDVGDNLYRCGAIWQRAPRRTEAFARISRERTFRAGRGLIGRVAATAAPLWLADVSRDADFARVLSGAQDRLRSACALPIIAGQHVIGVIEFLSHEMREPDEKLLLSMAELSRQIEGLMTARAEP